MKTSDVSNVDVVFCMWLVQRMLQMMTENRRGGKKEINPSNSSRVALARLATNAAVDGFP